MNFDEEVLSYGVSRETLQKMKDFLQILNKSFTPIYFDFPFHLQLEHAYHTNFEQLDRNYLYLLE